MKIGHLLNRDWWGCYALGDYAQLKNVMFPDAYIDLSG